MGIASKIGEALGAAVRAARPSPEEQAKRRLARAARLRVLATDARRLGRDDRARRLRRRALILERKARAVLEASEQ